MRFIQFSLLLVALAVAGCGKDASHRGKATALTIMASFPESETGSDLLSLTIASTVLAEETTTETTTETNTETAPSETVARETSVSAVKSVQSPLLNLGEDLAGAEKVFTHKRAFRWFSYVIANGATQLKSDSVEIDDPSITELKPIEVSARVGDQLSLKLSFMQVDFLSESDAKGFCDNGSVGFVRTWDATSIKTVDDSGVISVNFEESGRTAVTMAAIRISQDQLATKSPETLKSTLLNEHTGFRLSEGVCPVKNLYPNFESPYRFMKVMTFLRPLKPMQLIHFNDNQKFPSLTEAGGWKAFLKGLTQPATQRELGVSSAFEVESSDSGWNLVPALFEDVLPKELSPRLPLSFKKPETEHATRPTLIGNHLRYNASGALTEKVKVELLTLGNASTACNAGSPIASYADHPEDVIDIPVLLGQGAGTYMLRIRTTFADKTQVCSTTPLKIDVPAFTPDSGENKIASGENHTCAISGGQLYCWGQNDSGQVTGTASELPYLVPAPVSGLGSKTHAVFAGPNHTCAIVDVSDTEQAVAKCWGGSFPHTGSNPFYSLSTSATHIIATSSSFTCAVSKSGDVSCVRHDAILVPLLTLPATNTAEVQVAMSANSLCVAQPNTQIQCITLSGSIGSTSPTATTLVNIAINDSTQFRMVSDGINFYGLLEGKALFWSIDSTITMAEPSALPEQVQGATSIHASNGNVCAVKDGMPICWGNNSGGQFIEAAGTAIPSEKAQMIPDIRKPSQLSLGAGHVCAIQGAAGNLRCWGRNENGQLGINRTTISEEPAMTTFNVVAPLKAQTGTAAQTGTTIEIQDAAALSAP